jgi:ABC-2 type transport system permease protein/oleandomycin transport system permease protein
LFFSTLQPIMFVLLFRYVFGGAISAGPGITYIDFLMAGIFVQSVAFGGIGTAVGLADDLQKGLIERFRALPMARSAVLAGRTTADVVRNVFVLLLMTGVGWLVGFDFPRGALPFIAGAALILLFAYAMLWFFAVVGLIAPNSETAQVMAFPVLFPLIFASPAFVRLSSLPGWLRAFASHQPVGAVIQASRALMIGGRAVGGSTTGHVLEAVAWCAGFFAVLIPLAVWRYRKTG